MARLGMDELYARKAFNRRVSRTLSPIDLTYTSRSNETFMERTGETARQLVGKFSQNILMVGHGAVVLGITTGLLEGYPLSMLPYGVC